MNNPRFPHSVVIKRQQSGDSFTAPSEVTLYSGTCRNERFEKRNVRNGVMESDYRMSMPHYTPVPQRSYPQAGDLLTVTTPVAVLSGVVVDFEWNNLGITLWWNSVNN